MPAMKKISSNGLVFTKRVFPILWFGFLVVFLSLSIAGGAYQEDVVFLIGPCVMAVFGFFLMKKLIWDLVDEVHDCGDTLLVRNRGEEERVALSNIMNVNASMNMRPPRITLRLAKSGKFGSEISFSPVTPFTLNPFARNPIVDDLIVRVDEARAKRVR